jgi:alpha-tubulin suppressor-like RCC1 family protein
MNPTLVALRCVGRCLNRVKPLVALLALNGAGCGGLVVMPSDDESASDSEGGSDAVEPAAPLVQISAKWDHVCAIDERGTLSCWGVYLSATDGIAETFALAAEPRVIDPGHRYRKVSAGIGTTCAIRSDGSLWCWGHNQGGALATGDRLPSVDPVRIGEASDWEQVAVGSGFVCGLRAGGALYCWGGPDYGEVIDGPLDSEALLVPTFLGETFIAVDSHWYRTVAIKADGSVWSSDNNGLFGFVQGFEGLAASVSVGVSEFQIVDREGALSRLHFVQYGVVEQTFEQPNESFTDAHSASYARCAVSEEHELFCAPKATTEVQPLAPFGEGADWTEVGVGQSFGCGVRLDGSIWCWGTLGSGFTGSSTPEVVEYGPAPVRVQ